jgi:hypothetical protein
VHNCVLIVDANPNPHLASHLAPAEAAPAGRKAARPGIHSERRLSQKDSIAAANARLAEREDKTDFSDLVQALLEAWINTRN